MTQKFRLTLAQLNPSVGDIEGNAAKARAAWQEGREAGADLVMLPESFLIGYQPQDLVRRPGFWREAMGGIETLARDCADGPALGIGAPFHDGEALYNAYYILQGGAIIHKALKQVLPNVEVFDEKRLFARGPDQTPCQIGPLKFGLPICEDAWWENRVCSTVAKAGAEILLVPNGSPYHRGK
ncbi:MAG: nitrilase-related carbon-nitrogen hydrolase, partial [Maritimibacter sp.]